MEHETDATLAVAKQEALPITIPSTAASPQERRVMEVTEALAPAYAKASTLEITEEETKALTALFPDDAIEIRPHDGLIYIPHIFISDRLNEVFKPGKWVLMRRREWFDQSTQVIYGEYVLLIRGCFVGESVGGHPFAANNPKTNYSDALESTAAEALRRIAGKRLSCGGQVWKPEYARQWVANFAEQVNGKWRRRAADASGRRPSQPAAQPRPAAPAPQSATRPAARTADVVPPTTSVEATPDQRNRFIALFPGDNAEYAVAFFKSKGWLKEGQHLDLLPLKYVPTTKKVADDLVAQVEAFTTRPQSTAVDEWRAYKMPWGRCKDIPLAELEKNYLYGLVLNYEVEREYNGQPKKPEAIAKDEEFREMLNQAGRHYNWLKEGNENS